MAGLHRCGPSPPYDLHEMPTPRVAIVGRPNAGKSSLLNMIAGARVSIVDSTPGTTRDRVSRIVELPSPERDKPHRAIEFTDTGGFGVYTAEGQRYDDAGKDLATLTGDIESQISKAIETADLILFAVDAQAGITPPDLEIARLLREQKLGKTVRKGQGSSAGAHEHVPVMVVATKVDGPRWEPHAMELAALGFGEPIICSAENNYHRRDLIDTLYDIVPHTEKEGESLSALTEMKLAIVGKRNAGKSTLVNTLAGEPRVIVSEIAGTTRDAIDVRFEMDGRALLAIDTAGLRRKKSLSSRIEWYALDRAKTAIERGDVALLLIDATEPISQVDEQLAMLLQKAFKPVVIVVNKWDLAEGGTDHKGRPATTESYEKYIRDQLRGLDFAPISFISAENNLNIRETVNLAFELFDQSRTRVTTGVLNRMLRDILDHRQPSSKLGTRAKLLYVAQVEVAPPTIVMVVNRPDLFRPNYQRFLMNRFREELPFPEVPIRLVIRARKRDEEAEPVSGAPEAEAAAASGPEGPGLTPLDADAYFDDESPPPPVGGDFAQNEQ
jgi:GTP-binding protein